MNAVRNATADKDLQTALFDAALTVAGSSLSDAFGHRSVRGSPESFVITSPAPLAVLTEAEQPVDLHLDAHELPPGAPREVWILLALTRDRPGMGSVCGAQPPNVAAWAALQLDLVPLNGRAALMGEVAVSPDSRPIRDGEGATRIADAMATLTLSFGREMVR